MQHESDKQLESNYATELHSLLEPAGRVDTGYLLPDVTEALKSREEGREESTPEQHYHQMQLPWVV